MQRLFLNHKRMMAGLLFLCIAIVSLMPVAAQDDAVQGDIYVATNTDDGQLLAFWMNGDEATVLVDETFDAEWRGWRLGEQSILLYTNDLSEAVSSNFALVNADGFQFIDMSDDLQNMFNPPHIVNFVLPYVVVVTDVESEYSPALLINLDTATADILTMDYPIATPFRLSEDGASLRYAEHGEEVTDQNIVELDIEAGESTVVNTASSDGRLYPDRFGETWVEIRPTPINPLVNLYGLDGQTEMVADGAQEEWYWVVGNYLVTNTDACNAGNCLYAFRSLRDDSIVSMNVPEGIGLWLAQTLDDGRLIVADTETKAFWLLGVLQNPTQLGFTTGDISGSGAIVRLSPDERWLVVESVATPGDPNLAVRIMDVDTTAIAGSTIGDGSIHGIWFGDNGILIEMVTTAVLFNENDRSISRLPNSEATAFHAVLPDNSVLYSITHTENEVAAGVYHLDVTSQASTLLFENVRLLQLN